MKFKTIVSLTSLVFSLALIPAAFSEDPPTHSKAPVPAVPTAPATVPITLTLAKADDLGKALKTLSGEKTEKFPNLLPPLTLSPDARIALFRDVQALQSAVISASAAFVAARDAEAKADAVVWLPADPKTGFAAFDLAKMTADNAVKFSNAAQALYNKPFIVNLQTITEADLKLDVNVIPPTLSLDLAPILK